MTKARLTTAISALTEHANTLEQKRDAIKSRVSQLQMELDSADRELASAKTTLKGMSKAYNDIPASYDVATLSQMHIEEAVREIALLDEGAMVDTTDVLPILYEAGLMPEGHNNPARSLSGVLGASALFERIGPGKFRLVAEAMPSYGQTPSAGDDDPMPLTNDRMPTADDDNEYDDEVLRVHKEGVTKFEDGPPF